MRLSAEGVARYPTTSRGSAAPPAATLKPLAADVFVLICMLNRQLGEEGHKEENDWDGQNEIPQGHPKKVLLAYVMCCEG